MFTLDDFLNACVAALVGVAISFIMAPVQLGWVWIPGALIGFFGYYISTFIYRRFIK